MQEAVLPPEGSRRKLGQPGPTICWWGSDTPLVLVGPIPVGLIWKKLVLTASYANKGLGRVCRPIQLGDQVG